MKTARIVAPIIARTAAEIAVIVFAVETLGAWYGLAAIGIGAALGGFFGAALGDLCDWIRKPEKP